MSSAGTIWGGCTGGRGLLWGLLWACFGKRLGRTWAVSEIDSRTVSSIVSDIVVSGAASRIVSELRRALFWQLLVAFGNNAASFVDSVAALSQGAFAVPNHEAIDHRSGASPGATTKQSRC